MPLMGKRVGNWTRWDPPAEAGVAAGCTAGATVGAAAAALVGAAAGGLVGTAAGALVGLAGAAVGAVGCGVDAHASSSARPPIANAPPARRTNRRRSRPISFMSTPKVL